MSVLSEKVERLMVLFEDIKMEVRNRDKQLYERWRAGGFAVDWGFVSMYPALEEVAEQLEPGAGEEDEGSCYDPDDPET